MGHSYEQNTAGPCNSNGAASQPQIRQQRDFQIVIAKAINSNERPAMAQRVKPPVSKSADLSVILRGHMIRGKNWLSGVLWPPTLLAQGVLTQINK